MVEDKNILQKMLSNWNAISISVLVYTLLLSSYSLWRYYYSFSINPFEHISTNQIIAHSMLQVASVIIVFALYMASYGLVLYIGIRIKNSERSLGDLRKKFVRLF
jgi:uncharacterized membrane protein